MYIYKVIPLITIPRQHIQLPSYFSAQRFKPGQLVEVPIRTRKVPALIVSRSPAEKKKQDIRKSAFKLKNIEKALTEKQLLSKEFLKLAANLSDHYFSPIGLMLRRMLPPFFSKPGKPLLKMLTSLPEPVKPKNNKKGNNTLITAGLEQRKKIYKKYSDAQGVLLMVPEIMQIPVFESGAVNKESVQIKSGLGVVEWRNAWRDAYTGKVKNITGTRSALFTPLKNLKTIIIENENNSSHVSWDMHPKFDARRAAEKMGEIYGVDIIEGDLIPSIEKYHKAKNKNWEIIKKPVQLAKSEIIDMKKELEDDNTSILSRRIQERIENMGENEKMFLFIARRGLSSALVCRDCGHIVNCPECDTPAVLHEKGRLICHRCGKKMGAPDVCPSCRSNRIKSLGGGTQLVAGEVKKIAPELNIARIDSDIASTPEKQKTILEKFKNGKINILVGTHSALKEYMMPDMEYSAIVMTDALLYIPEYRASEQVYEIIWRIRSMANKQVFIQTYQPEIPAFKHANDADFENFFEQELKKRKLFSLPPYCEIIKLNYSHRDPSKAEREANAMKQKLEAQIKNISTKHKDSKQPAIEDIQLLGPAPGYTPKVKGKYVWYILIKWPINKKGDIKDLRTRNKLLNIIPPQWEIIVDPIELT